MELLSPRGGSHLKVNYVQCKMLKIRTLLENGVTRLLSWE